MNRHEGLEWQNVQAKLEANPVKLWSLHEMERTGSNPYEYEHKDSNVYTVSSAGRDGRIGTGDDIQVSNIEN